ncbi:MAG: superoxide dismutase [Alphaproteobacteria bacterium]|nr:superoxide dismutase [Alphaproteobacteria bacterium]
MSHILPPLPYSKEALEPHISAKTLSFHYDKHHQGYVTNLNNLLSGTALESLSLEEVIQKSANDSEQVGVFNNAAQVWNHTFFWNSLCPNGGGEPTGSVAELITQSFGSYQDFVTAFKQAAITQFGSGWVWLVIDGQKLSIMKTGNADLPMARGITALLTCDVWEHSYYLDYQNRRADYVDTFLTHLVNWSFAEQNLAAYTLSE